MYFSITVRNEYQRLEAEIERLELEIAKFPAGELRAYKSGKRTKFYCRTEEGDYLLDVLCSKGTYVRTLCFDIGQKLGCGACLSSLRRTEVGAFRVEQAHTMEELIAAAESGTIEKMLLGVDSLFPGMTKMTASAEQERMIRCGNAVEAEAEDGEALVYSASGELLMLGRAEGGVLYTIKSFFEV